MNVIRRFTLQSLKRNKKWTVVTVVGVIISTAMIAAVSTFVASLTGLMQRATIAETGNWQAAFAQVPAGNVHVIAEDKLIKKTILSRDVGYAKLAGSQNFHKPYLFIAQYDEQGLENLPVKLLSGRLPCNDREIVLSEQVKATGKVDYMVGDQITLAVGERELSGKVLGQTDSLKDSTGAEEILTPEFTATYTVVGIITPPGFEPTQAPGYTAITYLDDSKLAPGDTVDVSIIAWSPGRAFYSQVDALAQKAGVAKDKVTYNDALLRYYGVMGSEDGSDDISRSLHWIMDVMIAIILAVSVILIYNAFVISVAERTRQLGMLASVGATKRQKRQNVYFEGFLIGLTGIPLGILLGVGGSAIALAALNPFLSALLNTGTEGFRLMVSRQAILITILFSALAILISVYIPARRASRITPIDAIRQSREIKLTARTIRTSPLTRRLFGFEGELALKNLKRSKRKYRVTVLSLIVSIVLFLTVNMFGGLAGWLSSEAMADKINYDLSLHLDSYSPDEGRAVFQYSPDEEKAVYRQVAGLNAVKDYAVLQYVYGSIDAAAGLPAGVDQVALVSLDEEAFAKYAAAVGADAGDFSDVTKPQAILLNRYLLQADDSDVDPEAGKARTGDVLSLAAKLPGEDDGTKEVKCDIRIGAETQRPPLGIPIAGSSVGWKQFLLVTNEKTFDSLVGEGRVPSRLFVTTDDSANSDKLETAVRSVLRANDVEYVDGMIYNDAQQMRQDRQFLQFERIFAYGFIFLLGLIAVANMFNTLSTNVALRRKEFAMLRSVGMTPQSVNRMLRFESLFYGLKALLYGLPLSVALSWLLDRGIGEASSPTFSLPWKSYGAVVLLVLAIVAGTMFYSSGRIKKENIIDALMDDSN